MWPFKKKKTLPYAEGLNPAEHNWLQQQRDAFTTLASAAGLQNNQRLDLCDDLIRWWHAQPADSRPDPNLVVNATGIALGDALAAELRLEWKIITDPFGTDMGLWWTDGRGNIVLSPTHSVARKFADNPGGFVAALFKVMLPDVRKLRSDILAQ